MKTFSDEEAMILINDHFKVEELKKEKSKDEEIIADLKRTIRILREESIK